MVSRPSFLIRQAMLDDAASVAQVHVQAWQESYQGILDQNILDSLCVEQRLVGRLKFFPENSKGQFVACRGDAIVGFCDAGPARTARINSEIAKGEIYAIYVLNAYKGMGVGHELFSAAVSFLREHKLYPLIAWALTDNKPARAFYERQGGEICDTGAYTIADRAYAEVCYRFDSHDKQPYVFLEFPG